MQRILGRAVVLIASFVFTANLAHSTEGLTRFACAIFPFQVGRTEISDNGKTELVKRLAEIELLTVTGVVIEVWSDEIKTSSKRQQQMAITRRRSENIRQFLMEAGIEPRSISGEAKYAQPTPIATGSGGGIANERINRNFKSTSRLAVVSVVASCPISSSTTHKLACMRVRDSCS